MKSWKCTYIETVVGCTHCRLGMVEIGQLTNFQATPVSIILILRGTWRLMHQAKLMQYHRVVMFFT